MDITQVQKIPKEGCDEMTGLDANELRKTMSNVSSNRETFVHRPLDLRESSIRLIQILPELSSEGLIQCTISHETIEATYACLSYMWGPEHPAHEICMDDKILHVRQNLFDFLKISRMTPEFHSRRFWVDAISIDQCNTLERNHQVQQMGSIFKEAEGVMLWLGDHRALSILCDHISLDEYYGLVPGLPRLPYKARIDVQRLIYDNPYWNRAWVIQELLLARHVTVMQGTKTTTWSEFQYTLAYYKIPSFDSPLGQFSYAHGFNKHHNTPLVSLLNHFRGKQCTIPRDRIFSLFSICRDGASFKVDYNISDSEVVYEVLSRLRGALCFCSASIVAKSLSIQAHEPRGRLVAMEIPIYVYRRGHGRDCVIYPYISPINVYGDENIFKFPYSFACEPQFRPSLRWRKPLAKEREEIVFSFDRKLCTYGKGFEVFRKAEGRWVARIELWVFAKMSEYVTEYCSRSRGK